MTSKTEPQQNDGDAGRLQIAVKKDIVLPCACALKGEDITLYFEKVQFLDAINGAIESDQDKIVEAPATIDVSGPVCFRRDDVVLKNDEVSVWRLEEPRVHAALAFGGNHYSVTIRSKNGGDTPWEPRCNSIQADRMTSGQWEEVINNLLLSSIGEKSWSRNEKFWATKCSVAEILHKAIFPERDFVGAAGLVLITGGTGTGKTTILNAIAARYLHRMFECASSTKWTEPERRPHVVAVGDPVETLFHAGKGGSIQACGEAQIAPSEDLTHLTERCGDYVRRRIDFTARMIGTDVPSVSFALQDALRETPALYIVSELREEKDFKATLKFAESGQLVFATAHSTSLVDAMRKLMMLSWGEDTPHTRSLLAQRLKAVIHLKKIDAEGKGLTLPSLWLGNPAGVRTFVCDGLSSLLPCDAANDLDAQSKSALGRAWAAGKLFWGQSFPEKLDLLRAAHKMDLSNH